MKAGLPTLLSGAITLAATALDASEPGRMRAKLFEELKREFTFEPEPVKRDSAGDDVQDNTGAVVLPDHHVVDVPPDPEQAIREYRGILERDEFTWRHGGTIRKLERFPFKPGLKWKHNPEHNGIDLLSFSW